MRFPKCLGAAYSPSHNINVVLYEYLQKISFTFRRLGRAIAQAVSRWRPTAAGSKPDLGMWDLWWDKVALEQVFSEFFGFPCNRRLLHQLLHNHPHVSSGKCTIGMCGRSIGTYTNLGDLQRDLRGVKSHPTKLKILSDVCLEIKIGRKEILRNKFKYFFSRSL
jgi:hypothetical protein